MKRVRAFTHTLLWSLLLGAFVCVSTPRILRQVLKDPILPAHSLSYHCSDNLFYYAAGSSNTSEELIASFDRMPTDKRILILERETDPASSLLAMLTAYLAWPHPVEIVDLAHTRAKHGQVQQMDFSPPAAVVLCRVPRPSDLPEGQHFGPEMELIPIALNQP
jgi:hypothetical protein